MHTKNLLFFIGILLFGSCQNPSKTDNKIPVDLIIFNGNIYTLDSLQEKVEVVVVKEGKIVFLGNKYDAQMYEGKWLDLQGKTLYPGFHEGHGHLLKTGYNLLNVDLRKAKSFDEVIQWVKKRAANTPKGQWVLGRNWHQDKWDKRPEFQVQGFPTHHDLSKAIPDHPVWLDHSSSHMGIANAKAMEIAGINKTTSQPQGGEFFVSLNGQPSGIFNETAQNLIKKHIPESFERDSLALEMAFQHCIENGITTFHDATTTAAMDTLFHHFGKNKQIKIRIYAMLAGWDNQLTQRYFKSGPQLGLYENRLWIRAIKLAIDGALGSRGAWLSEPYEDAPQMYGHVVMPVSQIKKITQKAYEADFQVGIHAIGDRANHEVLNLYEALFKENPKDNPRFRIEHAQHLLKEDIPRFQELGVIPAMQAIHMASDRPWAIDRLGKKRIEEGAYMWQSLLQSGVKIVNGTDVPVEPLNPIACLYASVTRKTLEGKPKNGYEPDQKMTRLQALTSYTKDAAYGAFLENEVGTLSVGKWADFTILNQDFLTIPENEILNTRVMMTVIAGEIVYDAEKK